MDGQIFRNAMRGFAGAVTIVSTGAVRRRAGLTATSVCSLSDDPPSLLVCVNRNAAAHNRIQAERAFGIAVLNAEQDGVAECFAGRRRLAPEQRFAVGIWHCLATGAPLLRDAVVNFDCELAAEHAFKTHSIFIGLVRDIRQCDGARPLLYLRGGFARL